MNLPDVGFVVALIAAFGLIYPHLVYPVILFVMSKVVSKPLTTSQLYQPMVDVCIAVYNEEDHIEKCLRSILSTSYPHSKIRVLVGNDGSTDGTQSLVEKVINEANSIKVVSYEHKRSGKNIVLNDLMSKAIAEVVVFTDADCRFKPDSISELVLTLSDDSVGAVIGKVIRHKQSESKDTGERGEAAYRDVDARINALESAVSSTVTSNGPLYAVRREFLEPVPNSKVADDWANLVPSLFRKKRVVLNQKAMVEEEREVSIVNEIRRTIRTASGGIATALEFKRLCLPTYGSVAFFFVSHRIIRWKSPWFLVMLMVGTVMSVENTALFGWLFYGQFVLYALALLGYAGSTVGQRIPVASTFQYYVAMNYCFAVALWKVLVNKELDKWNPERGA